MDSPVNQPSFMKLFLVWFDEYDEKSLCDIFTTREKAQHFIDTSPYSGSPKNKRYSIEMWEIQE